MICVIGEEKVWVEGDQGNLVGSWIAIFALRPPSKCAHALETPIFFCTILVTILAVIERLLQQVNTG